jgi:NarL family two-component system response regulator YdfI
MAAPVRILICDDHQIVRDGLRLILETVADFEVVGEATDGSEALAMAEESHPDVILMDLRMPGMDGLTAIAHLKETAPKIAVVILTTYNEDDLLLRGLQLGARGYLLKDTDRGTLFDTIRAATRGETLLKPEILARLLPLTEPRAGAGFASAVPNGDQGPALTEREMEVILAASRGDRSKEIALNLGISERTVKAHLASIYNKLGVDSRAAAIALAAQRGWLDEV